MSEKIVGMRAPPGFAATAASAKDAELRALKNQLEQAEKQVTARTSQLEQAENQITAVTIAQSQAESQLQQVHNEMASRTTQLTQATNYIAQMNQTVGCLKSELARAGQDVIRYAATVKAQARALKDALELLCVRVRC